MKSGKSLATGWIQSSAPLAGLTARIISPVSGAVQKWMPSTPARPRIAAPTGVQK